MRGDGRRGQPGAAVTLFMKLSLTHEGLYDLMRATGSQIGFVAFVTRMANGPANITQPKQ